ncbi:MAG: dihydroxyacetone kinase subunit DhaK, partial [Selenomonadaceae bacterium]|nr:dihydroxyacetone kinase subunit DhaK [Selenomonadaceae bacterium]
MKKIINNAADVEREMLEGLVAASPKKLVKLNNYNIVLRANLTPHKVALVSGGGSGHEPAHAGYVGFGMLDAAVAGSVFTSPTA